MNLPFAFVFAASLALSSTRTASALDGLGKLSDRCESAKSTDLCVAALLAYRCKQLNLFVPALGNPCVATALAVPKVLQILRTDVILEDADGKPTPFNLPLIYAPRLRELIQDPKVQAYLSDLAPALRSALHEKIPFSLYAFTFRYAGERATAIDWLAVLFQDTSWVKLSYRYLARTLLPSADENAVPKPELYGALVRLNEVLDLLEPDALAAADPKGQIHLYPEGLGAGDTFALGRTPYHYYPMAKLALELERGGAGERRAFFLAYLFNAEYEFQTLDPQRWPLRVPAPTAPLTASGALRLRDVYAGYLGALFGISRERRGNFADFAREFAESPFHQLQRLLGTPPN